MSYKAEVFVQGEWASNGLRFATHEEADGYGLNLGLRWTLVEDVRVAESDEPVNYAWTAAGLEAVSGAAGQ